MLVKGKYLQAKTKAALSFREIPPGQGKYPANRPIHSSNENKTFHPKENQTKAIYSRTELGQVAQKNGLESDSDSEDFSSVPFGIKGEAPLICSSESKLSVKEKEISGRNLKLSSYLMRKQNIPKKPGLKKMSKENSSLTTSASQITGMNNSMLSASGANNCAYGIFYPGPGSKNAITNYMEGKSYQSSRGEFKNGNYWTNEDTSTSRKELLMPSPKVLSYSSQTYACGNISKVLDPQLEKANPKYLKINLQNNSHSLISSLGTATKSKGHTRTVSGNFERGGKVELNLNFGFSYEHIKKFQMKDVLLIQKHWRRLLRQRGTKSKKIITIQSFWRGYWLRARLYSLIYRYYIGRAFIRHLYNYVKIIRKRKGWNTLAQYSHQIKEEEEEEASRGEVYTPLQFPNAEEKNEEKQECIDMLYPTEFEDDMYRKIVPRKNENIYDVSRGECFEIIHQPFSKKFPYQSTTSEFTLVSQNQKLHISEYEQKIDKFKNEIINFSVFVEGKRKELQEFIIEQVNDLEVREEHEDENENEIEDLKKNTFSQQKKTTTKQMTFKSTRSIPSKNVAVKSIKKNPQQKEEQSQNIGNLVDNKITDLEIYFKTYNERVKNFQITQNSFMDISNDIIPVQNENVQTDEILIIPDNQNGEQQFSYIGDSLRKSGKMVVVKIRRKRKEDTNVKNKILDSGMDHNISSFLKTPDRSINEGQSDKENEIRQECTVEFIHHKSPINFTIDKSIHTALVKEWEITQNCFDLVSHVKPNKNKFSLPVTNENSEKIFLNSVESKSEIQIDSNIINFQIDEKKCKVLPCIMNLPINYSPINELSTPNSTPYIKKQFNNYHDIQTNVNNFSIERYFTQKINQLQICQPDFNFSVHQQLKSSHMGITTCNFNIEALQLKNRKRLPDLQEKEESAIYEEEKHKKRNDKVRKFVKMLLYSNHNRLAEVINRWKLLRYSMYKEHLDTINYEIRNNKNKPFFQMKLANLLKSTVRRFVFSDLVGELQARGEKIKQKLKSSKIHKFIKHLINRNNSRLTEAMNKWRLYCFSQYKAQNALIINQLRDYKTKPQLPRTLAYILPLNVRNAIYLELLEKLKVISDNQKRQVKCSKLNKFIKKLSYTKSNRLAESYYRWKLKSVSLSKEHKNIEKKKVLPRTLFTIIPLNVQRSVYSGIISEVHDIFLAKQQDLKSLKIRKLIKQLYNTNENKLIKALYIWKVYCFSLYKEQIVSRNNEIKSNIVKTMLPMKLLKILPLHVKNLIYDRIISCMREIFTNKIQQLKSSRASKLLKKLDSTNSNRLTDSYYKWKLNCLSFYKEQNETINKVLRNSKNRVVLPNKLMTILPSNVKRTIFCRLILEVQSKRDMKRLQQVTNKMSSIIKKCCITNKSRLLEAFHKWKLYFYKTNNESIINELRVNKNKQILPRKLANTLRSNIRKEIFGELVSGMQELSKEKKEQLRSSKLLELSKRLNYFNSIGLPEAFYRWKLDIYKELHANIKRSRRKTILPFKLSNIVKCNVKNAIYQGLISELRAISEGNKEQVKDSKLRKFLYNLQNINSHHMTEAYYRWRLNYLARDNLNKKNQENATICLNILQNKAALATKLEGIIKSNVKNTIFPGLIAQLKATSDEKKQYLKASKVKKIIKILENTNNNILTISYYRWKFICLSLYKEQIEAINKEFKTMKNRSLLPIKLQSILPFNVKRAIYLGILSQMQNITDIKKQQLKSCKVRKMIRTLFVANSNRLGEAFHRWNLKIVRLYKNQNEDIKGKLSALQKSERLLKLIHLHYNKFVMPQTKDIRKYYSLWKIISSNFRDITSVNDKTITHQEKMDNIIIQKRVSITPHKIIVENQDLEIVKEKEIAHPLKTNKMKTAIQAKIVKRKIQDKSFAISTNSNVLIFFNKLFSKFLAPNVRRCFKVWKKLILNRKTLQIKMLMIKKIQLEIIKNISKYFLYWKKESLPTRPSEEITATLNTHSPTIKENTESSPAEDQHEKKIIIDDNITGKPDVDETSLLENMPKRAKKITVKLKKTVGESSQTESQGKTIASVPKTKTLCAKISKRLEEVKKKRTVDNSKVLQFVDQLFRKRMSSTVLRCFKIWKKKIPSKRTLFAESLFIKKIRTNIFKKFFKHFFIWKSQCFSPSIPVEVTTFSEINNKVNEKTATIINEEETVDDLSETLSQKSKSSTNSYYANKPPEEEKGKLKTAVKIKIKRKKRKKVQGKDKLTTAENNAFSMSMDSTIEKKGTPKVLKQITMTDEFITGNTNEKTQIVEEEPFSIKNQQPNSKFLAISKILSEEFSPVKAQHNLQFQKSCSIMNNREAIEPVDINEGMPDLQNESNFQERSRFKNITQITVTQSSVCDNENVEDYRISCVIDIQNYWRIRKQRTYIAKYSQMLNIMSKLIYIKGNNTQVRKFLAIVKWKKINYLAKIESKATTLQKLLIKKMKTLKLKKMFIARHALSKLFDDYILVIRKSWVRQILLNLKLGYETNIFDQRYQYYSTSSSTSIPQVLNMKFQGISQKK